MTFLIRRKRARRDVLRGMLAGSAVTVALPFLDCDLNDSGTALAATGAQLPVRFGTWNWGMGRSPGSVEARTRTGAGIGFGAETQALKPYEKQLLYFDGYNLPLDGRSNFTHYTGWVANRTGSVPATTGDIPAPTLDLLVADQIGTGTRFKTIDVTSTGVPDQNYSARGSSSKSAAEVSPISLYTRLFGPEFVDPNKADFKPNPSVMARKSVLSAVLEDNRSYFKKVGAADQARLDEYFTSVRELESQLAIQLEKPPHNDACIVPKKPAELAAGASSVREIPQVLETHEIMANMLAMAVACNQTNVFNMVFSDVGGNIRRLGEAYTHHLLTHNETLDAKLGYQPSVFALNQQCMVGLATYLKIFSGIKEGAGTLLDNCLIFATTESNWARVHSIDSIPIMFAGSAGGRLKQGMHVAGSGDPVTRVGFTAMTVMGVKLEKWGTRSLETSKVITDVLV